MRSLLRSLMRPLLRSLIIVAPLLGAALLTLDFTEPVAQTFPTSGLVLGQSPTALYTCQETSGALVDQIGSANLTASGSPLQGQTAVGIWNGTDFVSRNAIENVTNRSSDRFAASGPTIFDYDDTASFAFLVVFRSPTLPLGAALLRKFSGGVGYDLQISKTSGVRATVNDGTTSVTAVVSSVPDDGAWHAALVVVDRTADEIRLYTDMGTDTQDISAVGDISVSSTFGLGAASFTANAQWTYVVNWEAAAAEALDATAFNDWWVYGQDPTGLLTTNSRASLLSVVAHNDGTNGDYVAHWSNESTTVQIAHGYDAGFSGDSKIYLTCTEAITNLYPQSEDFSTGWSLTNITVTPNYGDAPDGFRTSHRIVQDAADASAIDDVTGLTANGTFLTSLWIKVPSDHPSGKVRIRHRSIGAGSNDTTTTHTITKGVWTRVYQSFTLDGGDTTLRTQIYASDSTEQDECETWGLQVVETLRTEPLDYVRTSAGSAASAATLYAVVGDYMLKERGEYEVVAIAPTVQGNNEFLFSSGNTIGDRIQCFRNGSTLFARTFISTDQESQTSSPTLTAGTEYTFVHSWAEEGVQGGTKEAWLTTNGADPASDADMPLEFGPYATGFHHSVVIGGTYNGGSRGHWKFQRARVWARPR